MTQDTRPAPPAPVLPWTMVAILIAVGAGLLVPTAFFWEGSLVPAAIGLIAGLAGGLLGRLGTSLGAGGTLILAVALLAGSPGIIGVWMIGAVLIALAGIEASTVGGRSFVLSLYGFLSVLLVPSMPEPMAALPFLSLGVAWGAGATWVLGLTGRVAAPPAKPAFGLGLALFLFAGLVVTTWVVEWQAAPLGYWMVLLFIFRAVAPQGRTLRSALRYGVGATLGCGAAVLLTPLDLPPDVAAPLAFALIVVGLRMLPNPGPWSAAAFTAAILMGLAPGPENALFRLEAALFVVVLTAVLGAVIDGLWRLVARQGDGSNA